VLSGGEKSRLKLCSLMYGQVNVLLLDEPTNHLDIESREVLEENLLEYDGTLLFISHDRYFVDKLASRIGEIQSGKIKLYNGTYQYYKEEKAKEQLIQSSEPLEVSTLPVLAKQSAEIDKDQDQAENGKVLSKNAAEKLIKIEASIEELEEEIKILEENLINVGSNHLLLEQAMEKIEDKKKILDALLEKWEQITI
jgi:ATPase subunit of ABC transporter with duplicated ATPase domains